MRPTADRSNKLSMRQAAFCEPPVKRPNYFAGQRLSDEDFTAEQDYHKGKQRRHNLHCHGFHYKTDARETPQFGLIAEDVAKVNRALVLPDKEGKPYTVRYEGVNAMLLNEFLKEHRKVEQLEKHIEALTAGLQKVSAQLEANKATPQVVNNP